MSDPLIVTPEVREGVFKHVLAMVKGMLPKDISAALLCYTRDRRLFLVPAQEAMTPERKPVFAGVIQTLVKKEDVVLTCFVSEAWASPPDEPLPDVAPSEHPNRQEVLIVTIQTAHGFDSYTIELKDRQLVGEPQMVSTHGDPTTHVETVFDFFALVRKDQSLRA